jgi:hypothetical protein
MHESAERSPDERQHADQPIGSSSRPVPRIVLGVSRPFGRRHVTGVAVTRWLVAIWLAILGSIFCASGYWWGASLFAVAGLVGWLAYEMPRWSPVLDALHKERPPT